MQSKDIKLDLIQWLIETTDKASIKKVADIRNASSDLTPEQEAILNDRMEKYEKGLMKFSSWKDAKKRIVKKTKNAL